MQRRFESSVRVSGRGDSKAQACADALSGVQRAVMATAKQVLLRIEPMRVTVVAAEEVRRRERFLFFSCRGTGSATPSRWRWRSA